MMALICEVVLGLTSSFCVCGLSAGRLPLVASSRHRGGERGRSRTIGLRVVFGLGDMIN